MFMTEKNCGFKLRSIIIIAVQIAHSYTFTDSTQYSVFNLLIASEVLILNLKAYSRQSTRNGCMR